MKNIAIILVFVACVLLGCRKEMDNTTQAKKVLGGGTYKAHNNLLFTGQTQYSTFLQTAEFECGYISITSSPLSNNFVNVRDNSPPFPIYANNLLLSSQTTYNANQFSSHYGSTVNFQVGDSNAYHFNIYIPEIINITSPPITSTADLYPFCFYDQMHVHWNADQNNQDGIVAVVEWNGAMFDGARVESVFIRNTDIISNDNGQAVLNNDLFQDIPDMALATLYLIRGTADIYEIYDGTTIKLGGASIAKLRFVVVKDMSNYSL